jgi:hypothetical protein
MEVLLRLPLLIGPLLVVAALWQSNTAKHGVERALAKGN